MKICTKNYSTSIELKTFFLSIRIDKCMKKKVYWSQTAYSTLIGTCNSLQLKSLLICFDISLSYILESRIKFFHLLLGIGIDVIWCGCLQMTFFKNNLIILLLVINIKWNLNFIQAQQCMAHNLIKQICTNNRYF